MYVIKVTMYNGSVLYVKKDNIKRLTYDIHLAKRYTNEKSASVDLAKIKFDFSKGMYPGFITSISIDKWFECALDGILKRNVHTTK